MAKSRGKHLVAAVVLAVGGALLTVFGWLVIPRPADLGAPTAGLLSVVSGSSYLGTHLFLIFYTVDQLHPDLARVRVQVITGVPPRRYGSVQVAVQLSELGNVAVARCWPGCFAGGAGAGTWNADPYVNRNGSAVAYFYVRARSFGVVGNGVSAEAAFPALEVFSSDPAQIQVQYHVAEAGRYDWSEPPAAQQGSRVMWVEPVVPATSTSAAPGSVAGMTEARVASGVNHAADSRDATVTLIGGVMLGVGGSALVAAVQELLHD